MHARFTAVAVSAAALLATAGPVPAADAPDPAGGVEFFESKIRPLLAARCLKCHGETKRKGGLRLDTKAGWEKGGDSGPALVPGKPDRSGLIRAVRGDRENPPSMPPDSRLPPEAVADLVKWVEMGAPDPRSPSSSVASTATAAASGIDWKAAAGFWAFRPVAPVPTPTDPDPEATHPVDRHIAARLAEKGLTPAGPADKRTLIRRATFGLTGLPPTAREVEAFLTDDRPDAFAAVVDRLLASPRYGEHQARLWLDVARYGEDQAHAAADGARPEAWRYRDWVIEAFNRDVPYDRFVKLQIAADLMENADPADRRALGFFGLGPVYYKNTDIARGVAEELDDRVDTLTRGFLGLTVACARCHDHKYDPIPTQDYYSLAGVFASSKLTEVPIAPAAQVETHRLAKRKADEADAAAKAFLSADRDRVAAGRIETLPDYAVGAWLLRAQRLARPRLPAAFVAWTMGLEPPTLERVAAYLDRRDESIPLRAEWAKLVPGKDGSGGPLSEVRRLAEALRERVKADLAKPAEKRNADFQKELFSEKGVFAVGERDALAVATPERRAEHGRLKELAAKAAAEVPPAPPVAHGLAEAPKPADLRINLRGDPHKLGEPAPRRFLRVLAGLDRVPFARGGGSGRRELAEAIADPRNPLTARVMVNRVWTQHFGCGIVATPSNFGATGERPTHPELLDWLADRFVRDGWSVKRLHREIMLSLAYRRSCESSPANERIDPDNRLLWRMNRRRLAAEAWRDAALAVSGELDATAGGPSGKLDDPAFRRRTIYGKVSRLDLSRMLRLFDFPDPNITSERRNETTVSQQMLFLLNSPFVIARSEALAARFAAAGTPAERVRLAYRLALARPPDEDEIDIGMKYLAGSDPDADRSKNRMTRAARYAQALLASNEFAYVD